MRGDRLRCWVSQAQHQPTLTTYRLFSTDLYEMVRALWVKTLAIAPMQYRRAKISGGTYFFTVVTSDRRPTFHNPENVELLRQAFPKVRQNHPFTIDAAVILPEHLHCIWTLPEGERTPTSH